MVRVHDWTVEMSAIASNDKKKKGKLVGPQKVPLEYVVCGTNTPVLVFSIFIKIITSFYRTLGCPINCTDTYSQCYCGH